MESELTMTNGVYIPQCVLRYMMLYICQIFIAAHVSGDTVPITSDGTSATTWKRAIPTFPKAIHSDPKRGMFKKVTIKLRLYMYIPTIRVTFRSHIAM